MNIRPIEKKEDIERKKERKIKIFIGFVGIILLFTSVFSIISPGSKLELSGNYSFYLNGEKINQIEVFNGIWDYSNTTFIPCDYNGTKRVLFQDILNETLSPEDNCGLYNATFPGFNVLNETRNQELYSEVEPKTYLINDTQIDNEWLQFEGCLPCKLNKKGNIEEAENTFSPDQNSYYCGEGLIVSKYIL